MLRIDKKTLAAAHNGNEQALLELWKCFQPLVKVYQKANESIDNDIYQEAYLAFHNITISYNPRHSIGLYVKCVRNAISNKIKRLRNKLLPPNEESINELLMCDDEEYEEEWDEE